MGIKTRRAIVVNATALDRSGALSILNQFVHNIPDDDLRWIIFVDQSVKFGLKRNNIEFVFTSNGKSFLKRIIWDSIGVKKWIIKNHIDPICAISLQNTGFNVGKKTPTFIYYHQPIPFYPYKWNFFNKKQKIFWFYKHLYPFFVKIHLKADTHVFVQLEFIKNKFSEFYNHKKNFIHVIPPSLAIADLSKSTNILDTDKSINLFYPAAGYFYKNHDVIVKAIKGISKDLKLYLTISPKGQDVSSISDKIKYLGGIPYSSVLDMYKKVDAVVFPSYIETYGLPLLEAASFGLPIIAADLPYAREVLKGYEGVTFVDYLDVKAWRKTMLSVKKGCRYSPIDISNRPSWEIFFQILKKEIN